MNRKLIATGLIALMAAACMTPSAAMAAGGRAKGLRPDGSVPARWDLEKPAKVAHPDIAPASASGNGNGYNSITFGYFDDGDIVVVLGTLTGHAGVFDDPYYSGITSWAVISANKTPVSSVQREQCIKYRTYDEAYGLWVPRYWTYYGGRARNYARSKIGQPYVINSSKTDQSRWYCSKLCWAAWRYTAGVDLDADGGYWVWPIDLVNSVYTSAFGHWL